MENTPPPVLHQPKKPGANRVKSGFTFLSIANDSQTNNSVCHATLASFSKA